MLLQVRNKDVREQVSVAWYLLAQDSRDRILLDMERARQEGFLFGAKLVRGAYLYLERGRAEEKGYPSPIHDSIEATHDNYDR